MSSSGAYKFLWEQLKEKKSVAIDCLGVPVKKILRAISKEKNEDPEKNFKEKIFSKTQLNADGKKILLLELREISKYRMKYVTEMAKAIEKEES